MSSVSIDGNLFRRYPRRAISCGCTSSVNQRVWSSRADDSERCDVLEEFTRGLAVVLELRHRLFEGKLIELECVLVGLDDHGRRNPRSEQKGISDGVASTSPVCSFQRNRGAVLRDRINELPGKARWMLGAIWFVCFGLPDPPHEP